MVSWSMRERGENERRKGRRRAPAEQEQPVRVREREREPDTAESNGRWLLVETEGGASSAQKQQRPRGSSRRK